MRLSRRGFSLVELMIVVAIIGILAAIAVPNFLYMQLKSKRSEVAPNVDGIKIAEMAYDAAKDGFLTATVNPASTPGKEPRPWINSGGWSELAWSPEGEIRGSYSVTAGVDDFMINASCDVDADGILADYTATSSVNATINPADLDVY